MLDGAEYSSKGSTGCLASFWINRRMLSGLLDLEGGVFSINVTSSSALFRFPSRVSSSSFCAIFRRFRPRFSLTLCSAF